MYTILCVYLFIFEFEMDRPNKTHTLDKSLTEVVSKLQLDKSKGEEAI